MPETLPQPFPTPDDRVPARRRRRVGRGALVLAVLLVLAVGLAACGSDTPAGLTVGSTSVSESSVQGQLDAIAKNSTIKAQAVKDGKLDPRVVGSWLTALVETGVAKQAVEKAGTKVTKADKAAAQDWANGYFGSSSAFAAFPKSFRSEALARYAFVPAFVRAHTKAPTEAEVRSAYEGSLGRNCPSGHYVSHILVASQAAANAVVAELLAGQDFAQVAAKESTDTQSAQRGGALGCIDQQQIDPTFAAAAAATPVGTVSAPVHTQFGWHVIKVQDVAQALPYDSVKSEIRSDLVEQGPAGRKALVKLMAAAKVKVAKRFGHWQVKDGEGSVQPPTTTTKPGSSSTTAPAGTPTTTTTQP